MDLKLISIADLGLSNRSVNALYRRNISSAEELVVLEREDLERIRNLGAKSVDEILKKIERIKKGNIFASEEDNTPSTQNPAADMSDREYILEYLEAEQTGIDVLVGVSPKVYNTLLFGGFKYLHQIVFADMEQLMQITRMDELSAREVMQACAEYLKENASQFQRKSDDTSIRKLAFLAENREAVLRYVQCHDLPVEPPIFSNRSANALKTAGLDSLSKLFFMSAEEVAALRNMGRLSVEETMAVIERFVGEHESGLRAAISGDDSVLLDDRQIQQEILKLYMGKHAFSGLSFEDFRSMLVFPCQVEDGRLKENIGALIASGQLEYVDFRCYRIYPRFWDVAKDCPTLSDRNRDILRRRMSGETLESIGSDPELNLTRERIRQVCSSSVRKVKIYYRSSTGLDFFDEDYFAYLYSAYAFSRESAERWLGFSQDCCSYLETQEIKPGRKNLSAALNDPEVPVGLRFRIKNYLNRNKLFVDGRWVELNRAELEEAVAKKFCQNTVTFDEFVQLYNDFLRSEQVEDETLYITEQTYRTRLNHISFSKYVLWKQNEKLRYYDIEAQDFSELIDTLNLGSYENVDYSTKKFFLEYPELMARFDIQDHYELHNLLRKVVPEGYGHDLRFGKMPMLLFGNFDRDSAILDILIDNAPISTEDLCRLIEQEYGYDEKTIMGTYLSSIAAYKHQGTYSIDQKSMSSENSSKLMAALAEDFYFISEIREIYTRTIPDADPEEVNPYTLNVMGFSVLSRYVLRNHSSLDAYFTKLLTSEEQSDISAYRKRYSNVQAFSYVLMALSRSLDIIEFEPNQIISFKKLERNGIQRSDLQDFCDAAYDFAESNRYFSISSIRKDGFASELFDLGFSDWFYSSILLSDERFSFSNMFGARVFYKGKTNATIRDFLRELICSAGSIDRYDLITVLNNDFGCNVTDNYDVIYKTQNSGVYYDNILDRFYANEELYYRELDEIGGNML